VHSAHLGFNDAIGDSGPASGTKASTRGEHMPKWAMECQGRNDRANSRSLVVTLLECCRISTGGALISAWRTRPARPASPITAPNQSAEPRLRLLPNHDLIARGGSLTPLRVHQGLRQACRENEQAALSEDIRIQMVYSVASNWVIACSLAPLCAIWSSMQSSIRHSRVE
jgi:hypothetical protein